MSELGGQGLVDQLLAEAEALRGLLSAWNIVPLAILVAFGVLAYLVVSRIVRAAGQAGYDLERRIAGVRVVASAVIALWAVDLVARHVLVRAPLLGMSLLLLFAGGALFALAGRLQQAAGGIVMVLRGRVKEGDRLVVGEVSGIVEHAGLLRIRLRSADGGALYLPITLLDAQAVAISSPRRTQAVRVRVEREQPISRDDREALRRLALLCPYRQAGGLPELSHPDGDARRLDVRLPAWSSAAAAEAEAWLRRALAATTPQRGPMP